MPGEEADLEPVTVRVVEEAGVVAAIILRAVDVAGAGPAGGLGRAVDAKTVDVARDGKYERYKTSRFFDSTFQNPSWLG